MRSIMSAEVVLVATLALVNISFALAQDEEREDPCTNAADDAEMRSCRQAELDKARSDLIAVAADLSRSLAEGYPEQADALATAQKDWERFMDSECKLLNFESLLGTAGDIYLMDCQTRMTQARIADYKAMLDSP